MINETEVKELPLVHQQTVTVKKMTDDDDDDETKITRHEINIQQTTDTTSARIRAIGSHS